MKRMSKRVSLILPDVDEQAIAPFLEPVTAQHEALRRWAADHGGDAVKSEAGTLRALLQAGAEALRDEALDVGYADLAEIFQGDVERAERRTARDRYAARTDRAV
jgi:hypothetical protein